MVWEFECPRCKTKESINPSLVMMINECGHPLCINCLNMVFPRGNGPCPECSKFLQKKSFWQQKFSVQVERLVYYKKKLAKVYNLMEDDFPSEREYNDYLARIEELAQNLLDGVDLDATHSEIERFKEENAAKIERNKHRKSADEEYIGRCIKEDEERMKKTSLRRKEEISSWKRAEQLTRDVIEELKSSDLPAEVILDRRRKQQIEAELVEKDEAKRKKRMKMEAQQKRLDVTSFAPVRVSGVPFVYHPPDILINGPPMPSLEQVTSGGYLQHVRAFSADMWAGGFTPEICCIRALFESRLDLFCV